MPDLASGDVLLYTINYSQANQRLMNTLHLEYFDTDGAVDDYSAFANSYLSLVASPGHLIPLLEDDLSSTISIDNHTLQKVYPTRLQKQVQTLNILGTVGSAPSPVNTAMTFTKHTINATRWGLGSWHQPGIPAAEQVTSGVWGTGTRVEIATKLGAEFVGTKTVAGRNGVVLGILWNAAMPTRKTTILSIEGQPTIRTMYRRTVSVGK